MNTQTAIHLIALRRYGNMYLNHAGAVRALGTLLRVDPGAIATARACSNCRGLGVLSATLGACSACGGLGFVVSKKGVTS